MDQNSVLVGSAKGLILFVQREGEWIIKEIYFRGFPVSMIYIDPRDGGWWVALNHTHWGPKLHKSMDRGATWRPVPLPTFPDNTPLKKIWVMKEADLQSPNTYWIGTEPAALFQSNGLDHGICQPLWNHPSKIHDKMWFGTGRNDPFLHSVLVHPDNPKDIIIAISSAGIFRTLDKGDSWQPQNKGLLAAYLPNPQATTGHDPHMISQCEQDLNVIWQQNHCGIYLSKDRAESWDLVSDPDQHPHYGFCLAIDQKNPHTAWVIPAQSDEERVAPDLQLSVYKTKDFGKRWFRQNSGLPESPAFDLVLRNAFDRKDQLMAFGTNNGNLYFTNNNGSNWSLVSYNLAKILVVKILN